MVDYNSNSDLSWFFNDQIDPVFAAPDGPAAVFAPQDIFSASSSAFDPFQEITPNELPGYPTTTSSVAQLQQLRYFDAFMDEQPMNAITPRSFTARNRRHICNIAPCNGATFGRNHELRRHYASNHDVRKARFWCLINGCDRSKRGGRRAFPRKDKMVDHLMRVHGDRVGSAA